MLIPPPPPSRTANELVSEITVFLPSDLAWLVADFDAELKERCGLCKKLFGTRKVDTCNECKQDFHMTCLIQRDHSYCPDCLKDLDECVKCKNPVTSEELEICFECERKYHTNCFSSHFVKNKYHGRVYVCDDCFRKGVLECSLGDEMFSEERRANFLPKSLLRILGRM